MIPYARQSISEEDIAAVIEVLRSDWLTQGPTIERFEQAVADYSGGRHAVAVSNATAALHIACLALGLGPGDRLWTVANTFVASANCGRYCGASVDFVDIDPQTYNLSIDALASKLECAARAGTLPKILIPVHFAGRPCDMAAVAELAKRYGFQVIEDASHAIGAEYECGKVGNGVYSDITVFSFHPAKIITTGEGGMAVTNDEVLARRMRRLRTHGITRDTSEMTAASDGPWYYQQIELGFNYRLTDIQAALGMSQLKRLDTFVTRRRNLANRYAEKLQGLPLRTPLPDSTTKSAWHLYVVQLPDSVAAASRLTVFQRLREQNILVNVHYIPVHLQPYYRALGFKHGDFPASEQFYAHALTLPLFFDLSAEAQDEVCAALMSGLSAAGILPQGESAGSKRKLPAVT